MSDGEVVRREGFPFVFSCKRSGNCCAIPGGFVRVTPADVAGIAAHLGMSEAAVRSRFVQPDGVTLKDGLGGRCVFLAEGRLAACSIYPVRPARCREWPFWPEVLVDARLRELVERTCPGVVSNAQ